MNKKLIAILTLVMFALTLLPMGAFADSRNTSVGFVPTVTTTDDGIRLASIRISDDGVADNFGTGFFTLDLPSGLKWDTTTTVAPAGNPGAEALMDAFAQPGNTALNATRDSNSTMTIQITGYTAGDDLVIPILVESTSVGTGDIAITITDVTSGVKSGEVVVGRFSTAAGSVRMLSAPAKQDGRQTFGNIRLTENTLGALAGKTVELRLPSNVSWDETGGTDMNVTVNEAGGGAGELTGVVDGTNKRVVVFTFGSGGTASDATGIYDIPTYVNTSSSFSGGQISVSILGSANITESSIVIGRVTDYGVTVTAETAKNVFAAKGQQETAKIIIKEEIAGSIVAGRDIVLSLPSGVRFATTDGLKASALNFNEVNSVNRTAGDIDIPAAAANIWINSDKDKMYIRPSVASGTASTIAIKDLELDLASNFTGDVVVTVSGAAGVQGTVVVAKATKGAEVVAPNPAQIQIGKQGQPINEIHIKEMTKGFIDANASAITLTLDNGVEWSKLPTVEVVEGDIDLGTVSRNAATLTIPVDSDSTVPSTIKITNAAVTTDRSVPEGDVSVTLAGTGLRETTFTNANTVSKVKVATVTTPSEDGVVQPVVMTVGSTVYTVDGVEMQMDVAPYVKTGRTFFPVRFVASAVGISNDNVVWDGAQRTVTIFRGNRIVQVTIDSTTMLVNGIPLTMDVAPEITAGRTMLPIRFVAQGLNVNVTWDAATQTVTLN